MTLPAGLASHSLAMDDSPQVRGAIAVCRSMLERREAETRAEAIPERVFTDHAALVLSSAFRAQDTRAIVFRQGGVEVVKGT